MYFLSCEEIKTFIIIFIINIGPGKFFTLGMLAQLGTPQGATNLTIVLPFGRPNEEVGTLTAVRPVQLSLVQHSPSRPDPATHCEEEEDEDRVPFAWKDVSKCTSHFLPCRGILMWGSTL